MWMLSPSPEWIPYFGNQRRFVPFVVELLHGLGVTAGTVFHETCAGSHAVSYGVRKAMGLVPYANDPGDYSQAIGRCLYGDECNADDLKAASSVAARLGHQYLMTDDAQAPEEAKWYHWLMRMRDPCPTARVSGQDLMDFLSDNGGGVAYIDLPWPWASGEATRQYAISSGREVPDAQTILPLVLRILSVARPRYDVVVLSNQSSNFPPPEVLEPLLHATGNSPRIARRLTLPSERVDNLSKAEFFTEFQYVWTR